MKKDDKLSSYQAKQDLIQSRSEIAKRDNRNVLIAAAAAVVLAAGGQFVYFNFGPGYVPTVEDILSEEGIDPEDPPAYTLPSPDLAEGRTWETTLSIGGNDVALELDGAKAPQAVANFVYLAQQVFMTM